MRKDCRIVYHGSGVPVLQPEVRTNGFVKDFGFGFYGGGSRASGIQGMLHS